MPARKKAIRLLTNKTCKEITDLIFGYLNNTLSRSVKRDFQRHLRVCPDCVNFLNTYKKAVATSRSLLPEEMPANVRDNILDFLRKRVRKNALRS
jgi:putative zinc finger protein